MRGAAIGTIGAVIVALTLVASSHWGTSKPGTSAPAPAANAPMFAPAALAAPPSVAPAPAISALPVQQPTSAQVAADEADLSLPIRTVQELQNKGLVRHDEREVLHEVLSDEKVIAHAKRYLLEAQPEHLSPEETERRLGTITLLTEALHWKENPARAQVVSAFKDVIVSDNYHHSKDPQVKKSLAGDRYELYMALANELPDEAQRLLARAEQTSNAKLLRHAALVFANTKPTPP